MSRLENSTDKKMAMTMESQNHVFWNDVFMVTEIAHEINAVKASTKHKC